MTILGVEHRALVPHTDLRGTGGGIWRRSQRLELRQILDAESAPGSRYDDPAAAVAAVRAHLSGSP